MQLNFDATNIQPYEQGSICFPLGDYPFELVTATLVAVKDKPNCGMLEIGLKVLDGPYKGNVAKDRFNLYNDNPKAVEIAQRQLSSLCHSIKRLQIQDTQQLIGGRGIAYMGPQDNNDKYSEVKQYKDMEGRINGKGEPVNVAPQPVQAQQQTQTAQTTTSAPWTQQQPVQTQQTPVQNVPWGATTTNEQPTAAPAGNKPPWA